MNPSAVDTICRRFAQDHGQRLARQFVKTSGIERMLRRVEASQRHLRWMAALEVVDLAGVDLQHCLEMIHAQIRVDELDRLGRLRTEARAQRRHRPRVEHHPVRAGRPTRGPDASLVASGPEGAI